MSGKNFRVAPSDERTSVDGKSVRDKILLAMPDNEYEMMRADLTYIDLPSHLSLHEPTQNIEFAYFPNRGMVSQVVVIKDGRTVEVGVVGSHIRTPDVGIPCFLTGSDGHGCRPPRAAACQ